MFKEIVFVFQKTRQWRVYLVIGIMILFYCVISCSLLFGLEEPLPREQREISSNSEEIPEADYLLSPYDEIDIKVAGEDDLTGVYRVTNEGDIIFPILGRVKIDGLTISQTENKIAKLLEKDYFKIKPTIYIQVKQFHRRKVVISGEIRSPGPYQFDEGKSLTLVELITLAGGPTDKACLNSTTILRLEGQGKISTFKVKANDIMEAKEKDMVLKTGDRVNIPRASVIVMGEVAKPGTYDFGDANKMTLLGAVSMAGGFTRIAAINDVKIIRVDELGNKKNIRIKVNNIYNGKEKDVSLEPDDIIVVPESWF